MILQKDILNGSEILERELIQHTLAPVYDENSEILILGTMPSPKSRENGFYYGHPQNRFWRVLSGVLNEPLPKSNEEKKAMLLMHHIALWDVLKSCTIEGADDSSIKDPEPNDIASLIEKTNIRYIFTTGTKAYSLYNRYCKSKTGINAIPLPSTSPANRRYYNDEDVLKEYSVLLAYMG
ncbi:MAG: DNA-deoxyinosine glycosylase [Clostridia bacterium]|nr:DNA-deoxyinosine glycosylase [Clostridia bacterium]